MREITLHHDGHGLTESIELTADGPGPGGASHGYTAAIRVKTEKGESLEPCLQIKFQRGPRNVEGSQPGVVEAVLLAIVLDRMNSFNAGEFRCRENSLVATKVEEAMHWLKARADDRSKRGVLGKNEK